MFTEPSLVQAHQTFALGRVVLYNLKGQTRRADHHYSLLAWTSLFDSDSYPTWKFKYSVLSRQIKSRQLSLLARPIQVSSIIIVFITWLVAPRYLLYYLLFVTWSIKYLLIFVFSFTYVYDWTQILINLLILITCFVSVLIFKYTLSSSKVLYSNKY